MFIGDVWVVRGYLQRRMPRHLLRHVAVCGGAPARFHLKLNAHINLRPTTINHQIYVFQWKKLLTFFLRIL